MKNSFEVLKQEQAPQQCSEEKCATCFANRGCIYEQYLSIVINDNNQKKANDQLGDTTQPQVKRA